LIVNTNTIANPGTVMVHPDDTPVALSAVMDSWWFYGEARFAHFQHPVTQKLKFIQVYFDLDFFEKQTLIRAN
jgi:hypothetical protein